jgi:Ion channel
MQTRLIREGEHPDAWRDRARDLAFTTMLGTQCLIIFAVPFAAMGYDEIREVVALLFFIFTLLVCLISPGRVATILAILALISGLVGYALGRVEPSTSTALIFVFIGAITAFVVATYALGYATLAPGRVTFHRVLGAIALYLNIGLMFGAIYRMIWYFIPNSLTNIPGDAGWPAYGQILYFSFVTLTSTGFGDIVPLHPIIRMLVNVEAIIGQLYPATLLARLITLELRGERPRS